MLLVPLLLEEVRALMAAEEAEIHLEDEVEGFAGREVHFAVDPNAVSAQRTAYAGRDWDADVYDRVADPQEAWGREVLDRLPLAGDETVLDAGCGSGRVTQLLLERLPRGRVIGIDASAAMVEVARTRLGERAELRTGDLTELQVEAPVDAVFSNAVFHWVSDHDRLFERLYAALRSGGRLAAQCGARGNVASVRKAVRATYEQPAFAGVSRPPAGTWNFATAEETAEGCAPPASRTSRRGPPSARSPRPTRARS